MHVICEINWSVFKEKIEKEFTKEQAKRILAIINECEMPDPEGEE